VSITVIINTPTVDDGEYGKVITAFPNIDKNQSISFTNSLDLVKTPTITTTSTPFDIILPTPKLDLDKGPTSFPGPEIYNGTRSTPGTQLNKEPIGFPTIVSF